MTELSKIGMSQVWTHRKILTAADCTSSDKYQDYTVFGIPANYIVLGVKVTVLVNFNFATGNTATLYVGNSSVFPSSDTVSSVNNCYGMGDLVVPSGSGDSYQYGSFRWFKMSSPGSCHTISDAFCLPQRTDAHDVIARIIVSGQPSRAINLCSVGTVEITTQYGAI